MLNVLKAQPGQTMLTAVANKRKLEIATSTSDDVTPIYILEELWSILQSSGPETSEGFVEFVNRRLQHKSPVVKHKTLRLIKFLCEKGQSTFKRSISKAAKSVRDLTYYKGEPDPFKEDAPNQKVRDYAKEAVTAMFAPTETPSYQASQSALQSRIKGFGNSNMSDSVAPSAKPATGMLGFGSSKFSNASTSTSAKPPTSGGWNSRSSNNYEAPESSGREKEGFGNMMKRVGSGALSPKGIINMVSAKSSELRHGSKGQSILDDSEQQGYDTDEDDRGYTKPSIESASVALGGHSKSASRKPVSSSGQEARLVNQVCTPGGVRAQPSPEELRIFVESVGSLSGHEIAEQLENKLADPSWQAVLRALCAIEAIIKQGSTAACGEVAVHFQADSSAIAAAESLPQSSVRQRAVRVLELLGVSQSGRAAKSVPSATQSSVVPDLLGGIGGEAPTESGPTEQSRQTDGMDMLGDLMGGSNEPSHPTGPPSTDMFAGFDMNSAGQSQPDNPTAHMSNGSDLFGGLSVGSAQPASSHFADPFSAASNGAVPSFSHAAVPDALAGFSAGQATPTQALPDLFAGGLSISNPRAVSMTDGLMGRPAHPQVIHQSSLSIEKTGDPLGSLGLPQPIQQPMGFGQSTGMGMMNQHSRQSSLGSASGVPLQLGGSMPQQLSQLSPHQLQQLTPQQRQYIAQQLQQMHARQPQQGPQFAHNLPQPTLVPNVTRPSSFAKQQFQQAHGLDLGVGGFGGASGNQGISSLSQPNQVSSAKIGISQQTDFDFVNDHVKGLRGKK